MPGQIQRLVVSSLLLASVATTANAESLSPMSWDQWRGPHRDGRVDSTAWPADLSDQHLSETWTAPLGPSYSGPIVSANLVFVTETKDKKYEVVRALRRDTGEQVWETQWEGAMSVPFFAAANGSWIRATPAFDGERLYVAGMLDVLVCLDATSGNVLWKRDFVADTGSSKPAFGFASSPLLHGDHILVQAGASFAKLDKLTGEVVWQTLKDDGGMFGSAFSSPVFAALAGVPQFVVQTRTTLAGVSADDGSVLWSQEVAAFRGMNILTPTVIGDAIFTSSYGGKSTLYKIDRLNDEWKVSEAWTHKSQGYMSSPVVVNGNIYLHLRNQRFVCLDAASGAERWTTKPFGKYWSMVASDSRIIALDESGELLLIEPSPAEFKLVDRKQVANNAWAHLAIVGDEIFVRDLEAVKVFAWR